MHAISRRASTSSLDWKRGNFPAKKKRRIMPADHISIANKNAYSQIKIHPDYKVRYNRPPVCSLHFRSTSGARKPRVPARLALE